MRDELIDGLEGLIVLCPQVGLYMWSPIVTFFELEAPTCCESLEDLLILLQRFLWVVNRNYKMTVTTHKFKNLGN